MLKKQRKLCGSPPGKGNERGFTLIEMMIALLIMTFGLLAAGQLMYLAMSSASLARSKGTAAVAAQSKLQFLADQFRQNPTGFADGTFGPEIIQVQNPANRVVLNSFRITWNVVTVPDPRPSKIIHAKRVTVTVTPVDADSNDNLKAGLNKVVSVTSIFSGRVS